MLQSMQIVKMLQTFCRVLLLQLSFCMVIVFENFPLFVVFSTLGALYSLNCIMVDSINLMTTGKFSLHPLQRAGLVQISIFFWIHQIIIWVIGRLMDGWEKGVLKNVEEGSVHFIRPRFLDC